MNEQANKQTKMVMCKEEPKMNYNELHLWIYDSECTTDQIRTGVLAATDHLRLANVTACQALNAALARANGDPYDSAHTDAWDEAERIALTAANAGPRACLAEA